MYLGIRRSLKAHAKNSNGKGGKNVNKNASKQQPNAKRNDKVVV